VAQGLGRMVGMKAEGATANKEHNDSLIKNGASRSKGNRHCIRTGGAGGEDDDTQVPPFGPVKPELHTQAVCAMLEEGEAEFDGQALQVPVPVHPL